MLNLNEITLISSNCVDGWITQKLPGYRGWTNPFVWAMFDKYSYEILMTQYNNINFDNIVFFDKQENVLEYINKSNNSEDLLKKVKRFLNAKNINEQYWGIIDDNIVFFHMHMHFDKMRAADENKNCKNGLECLYNIYRKRLNIMKTKTPVFLYKSFKDIDFIESQYDIIYYNEKNNINIADILYTDDNGYGDHRVFESNNFINTMISFFKTKYK